MSGIVSSNKQMAWRADYSPKGEPSLNEFLSTLRVLHHFRRVMQKNCSAIFLCNSISDVIIYLECNSPKEIRNIVNLMYNS
ncbi:Uncharacterised protein [Chlamydia trachomatis]|nr:Uncharacterised protein [Chlamydia trachomatis]